MSEKNRNTRFLKNRYQSRFDPPTTRKGRKNLRRDDAGNLVNQHGVKFTDAEKRALTNAVKAVNRKHEKMLGESDKWERIVDGEPTGQTLQQQRQNMGKPREMIIAKRSNSMQRFRSREQFEKYMDELNRINRDPDEYINSRIREYKRNYIKALEDAYGDSHYIADIKMRIRTMKPDEYMKLVSTNEDLEIGYVYPDKEGGGKLDVIRKQLGLKDSSQNPNAIKFYKNLTAKG